MLNHNPTPQVSLAGAGVRALWIAYFVTLLLASYAAAQLYLRVNNCLETNGRWIATKTTLEKPPMGATHFCTERQTLRRNRLNLGAWHGFQEVQYYKALDVSEISFRFLLLEDTYIVFEFNLTKDPDSPFLAFRFSNYDLFDNAFLHVGPQGRFIEKFATPNVDIEHAKWNKCRMRFARGSIELLLNDNPVGVFQAALRSPQRFAFRGSYRETYVDDVVIHQRDSSDVIRDSFSNHRDLPGIFGLALCMLMLIHGTWTAFDRKTSGKHLLFRLITFDIVGLVVVVVAIAYFANIHSRSYPYEGDKLAELEMKWVWNETDRIRAELRESISGEQSSGVYRILFVGTSQTWGEGVAKETDSFVQVIERRLNRELKEVGSFECLNGGICGQDSYGLLAMYEKEWIEFNPHMVVANFSSNDLDASGFGKNLKRLIQINEDRGIKTLFVLEPNTIERWSPRMVMHDVMREVAEAHHVPIVDMHRYLIDHHDDGFIWWDHVHLASFGHRLIADGLYSVIMSEIGDLDTTWNGVMFN